MKVNWLTQQSLKNGDRPALLFLNPTSIDLECKNQVWTFTELEIASIQVAKNLINLGVKQGDRLGILAHNYPEFIIVIQALVKLNCIAILVNTRLSTRELQWQLQDSQTKFLIYSFTKLESTKLEIVNQLKLKDLNLLNLETVINQNSDLATDLIDDRLDFNAVQTIIYTSGTTGLPKGVQLTFGNHFASAIASANHLKIDSKSDRWLACLPLFHVGGLAIIWRSVIWGIPLVLLPKFDVFGVCQAIADRKITFVSLVPTMLVRILASSEFQNTLSAWQNLRGILLGGASASSELIAQCLEYRLPILPTYGLTEAASQVTTFIPKDLTNSLTKGIQSKLGSSGQALSCNHVRIVALENGLEDNREVEVGAIGQIWIEGDNVMKGYLHHPNLENNWFNTGDIGYLDLEGYLYVLNRRADLIISGGENIYPTEIESILLKHPHIQDVCAIGIEDREWGQIVVVAIEAIEKDINLKEIKEFCLNAGLSSYKLPKKLYIVDAIPLTANGKVSRQLVRELILETDLGT